MQRKMINIEINKIGNVEGEILWMCDKFVKITYLKKFWFIFKRKKTELFHISEVLNFMEIYKTDYVINTLK